MPRKYALGATHGAPPKIAPAIIAMNGSLAPQGMNVVVMMVIRRSRSFQSYGKHDARHAAACTDEDRNEGLTGKAELTEDTVHNERDTRHVTARLEECKEDEQNEHLRNEAENCANTGYDTVKDEALQPVCAIYSVQTAFDDTRQTRNPNAVIGGSGSSQP